MFPFYQVEIVKLLLANNNFIKEVTTNKLLAENCSEDHNSGILAGTHIDKLWEKLM